MSIWLLSSGFSEVLKLNKDFKTWGEFTIILYVQFNSVFEKTDCVRQRICSTVKDVCLRVVSFEENQPI